MKRTYEIAHYEDANIQPQLVRKTADLVRKEFLLDRDEPFRSYWRDVLDRLNAIQVAGTTAKTEKYPERPNNQPENRLPAAFAWRHTPEGGSYWARVDAATLGDRPITDAYEE